MERKSTVDSIIVAFVQIACGSICLLLLGIMGTLVISAVTGCDKKSGTVVIQPYAPAPQPVASTPSPTNQPAPSQVDFEDMAGLDVATQELLDQRHRETGPKDIEKRIMRLEWAVDALSDRVFGKTLLPGEGNIGEIGSDGTSEATND